jgi:hypothetical protein
VDDGIWDDSGNWTVSGVPEDDCIGYPASPTAEARFLAGTRATVAVNGEFRFKELYLREKDLDVSFVGTNAATCRLVGGDVTLEGDVSRSRIVFSGVELVDANENINIGSSTTEDFVLRAENGAILSLSQYTHLRGTNMWIESAGGSVVRWRKPGDANSGDSGLDLCNFGGGLRLDGGEADVPWLVPQRQVKTVGPGQTIEFAGASRFTGRSWFRTYSNSEDYMTNDVRLVFLVPEGGWGKDPAAAPLYASYARGGNDAKLLGWRDANAVNGGKLVFSVPKESPAFCKGRAFRTQLVTWFAGIDEKSVRLEDSVSPAGTVWAKLSYTYGIPSTRTERYYEGEIPTGIAADVIGQGGTFLIFR